MQRGGKPLAALFTHTTECRIVNLKWSDGKNGLYSPKVAVGDNDNEVFVILGSNLISSPALQTAGVKVNFCPHSSAC